MEERTFVPMVSLLVIENYLRQSRTLKIDFWYFENFYLNVYINSEIIDDDYH